MAGEEEGQLARLGAAAAEDTLGFHRFPGLGSVETHHLARFLQPVEQFFMVAEIDDQPLFGANVDRPGQRKWRCPARFDAKVQFVEFVLQLIGRVGSQRHNAADGSDGFGISRRLDRSYAALFPGRMADRRASELPRPLGQHPRHMFLEHQMEVRPTEAVGADARAARRAVALCPFPRIVERVERRGREIDVGVGRVGVEGGRQYLVMEGHGGFHQAGRARPRLQVTDVALGRAEADAAAGRAAEHLGKALDFNDVADAGAGAVGFNESGRGRI